MEGVEPTMVAYLPLYLLDLGLTCSRRIECEDQVFGSSFYGYGFVLMKLKCTVGHHMGLD